MRSLFNEIAAWFSGRMTASGVRPRVAARPQPQAGKKSTSQGVVVDREEPFPPTVPMFPPF